MAASARTPSLFWPNSAMAPPIFCRASAAKGFRSIRHFGQGRPADGSIAARAAAPSRPKAASDSTASVCRSAADLVVAIERRLAPDMHAGLGAETKPAFLLARLHPQRDQQPIAGSGDGRPRTSNVDRPLPSSGKFLALELLLQQLADLGEGTSMGTPMPMPSLIDRRTRSRRGGEGAIGLVRVGRMRVSA